MPDELPLSECADTQVVYRLMEAAIELDQGELMPASVKLSDFRAVLAACYNMLSPYNDYDLDIDL